MQKSIVALVMSSFHAQAMDTMLSTSLQSIDACGLSLHSVSKVPGAYEMPLAVKRVIELDEVDGVIVLGIIERGETAHGLVMGHSVSDVLLRLQLETMKPIGIGIIGPGIMQHQIEPRLERHARAAVEAVAHMLSPASIAKPPN